MPHIQTEPTPAPTPLTKLLDCNEAADILGVTAACLEKWRVKGNKALRWVRVGRCARYRVSDIEAFIVKQSVGD